MSKQITGCILYEIWTYGGDAAMPSADVTGFKWDLHCRPLTYMNWNVQSLINLWAILTHQQRKCIYLNVSVYCFLMIVDVWCRLLSSDFISVPAGAIQSLNFRLLRVLLFTYFPYQSALSQSVLNWPKCPALIPPIQTGDYIWSWLVHV